MMKNSDALLRRILRKADGLGVNVSRYSINAESLLTHGWTKVSDGRTSMMIELMDKGELRFFLCVKHLVSNQG